MTGSNIEDFEPAGDLPPEPGLEPDPASQAEENQAADVEAIDPMMYPPSSEHLGPDLFFPRFLELCSIPNVILMFKGILPLQAFTVDASDPAARLASDALYRSINRVPFLHFLLSNKGSALEDLATVGMFGFSLVKAAGAEISERAAAAEPEPKPEEKPDPKGPEDLPTAEDQPGVDQGPVELAVSNG